MIKKAENYLGKQVNILFITFLHHIICLSYLIFVIPANSFNKEFTFRLTMVFFLQISMYLAVIAGIKNKKVVQYIILTLSVVIWQFIINLSTGNIISLLSNIITPISLLIMMFSTISLLTIGREFEMKELFQVSLILIGFSGICFWIRNKWFIILTFFSSLFILLMPIIILVIYKKELSKIPKKMIIKIKWFSGLSLLLFFLVFWTKFPISIWFISIFILLMIFHIKTILKIIKEKLTQIREIYLIMIFKILIKILLLVISISLIFRLNMRSNYFLINGVALILVIIIFEFLSFANAPKSKNENKQLEVLLLKKNKLIDNLLGDESVKQAYSEYLHNEVLQSVIAIKNLSPYSNNSKFRGEIQKISEDLISSIRQELDNYQISFNNSLSLFDNYKQLLEYTKKSLYFNGDIQFIMEKDLQLLAPYNILVYRFIQELVTNACKYGDKYIKLKIELKYDKVILCVENDYLDKKVTKGNGYGLNILEKRLSIVGGNLEKQSKRKRYMVKITLPIDEEICYENFIN